MKGLLEKLTYHQGPFDIVLDPEVGTMELQEIGVADRFEYDRKHRFAFGQNLDINKVRKLIEDIAENLGLREGETEVIDKFSDKVTKTFVDVESLPSTDTLWVTFWFDARVGYTPGQGKIEMLIKRHEKQIPDRYDFYETKRSIWIKKFADMCKEEFDCEISMDEFNEFIKEKNLLGALEDTIGEGYDIWDLLIDINQKIESK